MMASSSVLTLAVVLCLALYVSAASIAPTPPPPAPGAAAADDGDKSFATKFLSGLGQMVTSLVGGGPKPCPTVGQFFTDHLVNYAQYRLDEWTIKSSPYKTEKKDALKRLEKNEESYLAFSALLTPPFVDATVARYIAEGATLQQSCREELYTEFVYKYFVPDPDSGTGGELVDTFKKANPALGLEKIMKDFQQQAQKSARSRDGKPIPRDCEKLAPFFKEAVAGTADFSVLRGFSKFVDFLKTAEKVPEVSINKFVDEHGRRVKVQKPAKALGKYLKCT